MTNTVKAEGWKEMAEFFGIVRGGAAENSIPSVVLKTTAAGSVQIEVKAYNPDGLDAASEDAQRVFNSLRELYG